MNDDIDGVTGLCTTMLTLPFGRGYARDQEKAGQVSDISWFHYRFLGLGGGVGGGHFPEVQAAVRTSARGALASPTGAKGAELGRRLDPMLIQRILFAELRRGEA